LFLRRLEGLSKTQERVEIKTRKKKVCEVRKELKKSLKRKKKKK
jgi:hypothetical protein